MNTFVLLVFSAVYFGMFAGRLPGLAIDRTGVALLGAIVLISIGGIPLAAARDSIDFPTMALLFGLMVVSSQFQLAGSYSHAVRLVAESDVTPGNLLARIILFAGAVSAVLANDIVCFASAPVIADICGKKKLDPKPYLLALAAASNIGSAATIIGNPQNMLIGQTLKIPFGWYLSIAILPVLLGLGILWVIIMRTWQLDCAADTQISKREEETYEFDRWQTVKGLILVAAVMAAFLLEIAPREITALFAAGVLLASRKMKSRSLLGLVDWHLLVLFAGLFVVVGAFENTGLMAGWISMFAGVGLDLSNPPVMYAGSVILSNIVSNVPATMLLLPAAQEWGAGLLLALSSTLAGNLIVVGSIANIIVLERAGRMGVHISWREHMRAGIPVTVATLAITAGWLYLLSLTGLI